MTERETERYQRNLLVEALSATGQQRLSESRVTVVGAGGLGSATLNTWRRRESAACGSSKRHRSAEQPATPDSLHDRRPGRSESGSRRGTAVAAESGLPDRNPHRPARRRQCGRKSCRIATSSWTAPTTTPPVMRSTISVRPGGYRWLYGTAEQIGGQVSVFQHGGGGSYRSLYPEQPVQQPIVELPPIVGVIGSLQALETIKLLAGIGDGLAGRLLTIDGRTCASSLRNLTLYVRYSQATRHGPRINSTSQT